MTGYWRSHNQPSPKTRAFDLSHMAPHGEEGITIHAETWAELQDTLSLYCSSEIASALDLAWVRPTPITKYGFTLTEITAEFKARSEEAPPCP